MMSGRAVKAPSPGETVTRSTHSPEIPRTNADMILPKLILGNQRVIGLPYRAQVRGCLTGVWVLLSNRRHQESFYPAGMMASLQQHRWSPAPQVFPTLYTLATPQGSIQLRQCFTQWVVGSIRVFRGGLCDPPYLSMEGECKQSTSPTRIIIFLQVGTDEFPKMVVVRLGKWSRTASNKNHFKCCRKCYWPAACLGEIIQHLSISNLGSRANLQGSIWYHDLVKHFRLIPEMNSSLLKIFLHLQLKPHPQKCIHIIVNNWLSL